MVYTSKSEVMCHHLRQEIDACRVLSGLRKASPTVIKETCTLVLFFFLERTCLMYVPRAACKYEFQPFNRSYSQLTFFNFYKT